MMKNPAEAEDLTQSSIPQTFRKIHTFRADSRCFAWLGRLTVDMVLMHLRKRKRSELSLDETLQRKDESPKPGGPDLNLDAVIDRVNLDKTIDQLPHGYKKMLILHNIEGYQHNGDLAHFGLLRWEVQIPAPRRRPRVTPLRPSEDGRRIIVQLIRICHEPI